MSQRDNQHHKNRASTAFAVLAAAGIGAFIGYLGHSLFSEGESDSLNRNASPQEVIAPSRSVPLQPAQKCVICQDELKAPLEQLPCSHLFHQNCLLTWLETSASCPTCRTCLTAQQLATYRNRTL